MTYRFAINPEDLVEHILIPDYGGIDRCGGSAAAGLPSDDAGEKNRLLHLFRGCDKRWRHSNRYEWFEAGSLESDARLPVLNWQGKHVSY